MDKIIPQNANFFEKMTACFGDLSQFEQKILQITQTIGLDLSQFQIDHLAVRMNTVETAMQWKELLLENATLLKESEVNDETFDFVPFGSRPAGRLCYGLL